MCKIIKSIELNAFPKVQNSYKRVQDKIDACSVKNFK